jgi:thiopeptide-type bacteriocin biosynthesis protein
MPARHLSVTSPHDLVAPVLAVLAGANLDTTAAGSTLDPAELDDAVRAYQAAGLAALEGQADRACYQVRVRFPDWSTAEAAGATGLGPSLDELQAHGAIGGWWFLRKHPCWRLRLHLADSAAVDRVLNELTTAGVLVDWRPTIYEPETTAFGGPAGMDPVHELFCADSHGVLDHLRRGAPGLGRRELSLLLLGGLLHAAGLDAFERGDVFARVARLRPPPGVADPAKIEELTTNIRALLSIAQIPASELFASGGPAEHAAPWLAAFQNAGRQLGEAHAEGRLDRGLRAILTHVVIFHWNRFGLSATTQAVLAHAAATALLPRD